MLCQLDVALVVVIIVKTNEGHGASGAGNENFAIWSRQKKQYSNSNEAREELQIGGWGGLGCGKNGGVSWLCCAAEHAIWIELSTSK